MIVVKLQGGLGNQMFQFALGKHLSLKNKTKLKLYLSYFGTQSLRAYELEGFNTNAGVISDRELHSLKYDPKTLLGRLLKYVTKGCFLYSKILENKFSFDPEVLKAGRNSYLSGYWQSEKYFKGIEPVIRQCFCLKDISGIDQDILRKIKNTNSVSIHIRRGDYVSNEVINKFHGICDMRYYDGAIKYISERVKDPVFFLFSDEIDWVKENFKIPFEHQYVSDNAMSANKEMILMSACKNNIIANSSFSWWAGWLNNNTDKIVIAPAKWFNVDSDWYKKNNINTTDLLPESWITF